MQKFKEIVVTICQVLLWLTFLFGINDPGLLHTRPPESLYSVYAFLIDPIYSVSSYIIQPVSWMAHMMGLYHPEKIGGWFPMTSAVKFNAFMGTFGLGAFFKPSLFAGAIIWWVPLTSFCVSVFSWGFSEFYERIRNWAWNIIIEYAFHRKKARVYQEVLDKKTADLERLNNQYRVLAEETHTLKDSVITDELTSVYNKRFFLNRLQLEFERCQKEKRLFSLIMIDIDFFKRLNDTYGHVVGDKVLKAVALVLKKQTPDDAYVCRYGGEEFSVIMPCHGVVDAMSVAQSFQENIQDLTFPEVDRNLNVTISQGVCTIDFAYDESKGIKSFDTALQCADEELYRSKINGRNRISINNLVGPKE